MPDPVTAGIYGGVSVGSIIAYKLAPRKTLPFAIVGMQDTGKSTMHLSFENGITPVYQTRIPTTQRGVRYRTRLKLDIPRVKDPWWKGIDYPHDASMVPDQVDELKPKWIGLLLATDTWEEKYNWVELDRLSKHLASTSYRHSTQAAIPIVYWLPGHGWIKKYLRPSKSVKMITIILNKIDSWEHLGREKRGQMSQKVIDYYMKDFEKSPMNMIKNEYTVQFIAASVEKSYYYPANNLDSRDKLPLKDYIENVGRHVL